MAFQWTGLTGRERLWVGHTGLAAPDPKCCSGDRSCCGEVGELGWQVATLDVMVERPGSPRLSYPRRNSRLPSTRRTAQTVPRPQGPFTETA